MEATAPGWVAVDKAGHPAEKEGLFYQLRIQLGKKGKTTDGPWVCYSIFRKSHPLLSDSSGVSDNGSWALLGEGTP